MTISLERFRLAVSLFAAQLLLLVSSVHASLQSFQISPGVTSADRPAGEFDFGSVSAFVNPNQTVWIAWNERPTVSETHPSRPGEFLLGKPSLGVDDFIRVTITDPLGTVQTIEMDRNDGLVFQSPQAVIFGNAADAPDVLRENDATGQITILDEGGAFNSLFSTAGTYRFDFSFQNVGGFAGNSDTWLLIETADSHVPEPASMLVVVGIVGCYLITKRFQCAEGENQGNCDSPSSRKEKA